MNIRRPAAPGAGVLTCENHAERLGLGYLSAGIHINCRGCPGACSVDCLVPQAGDLALVARMLSTAGKEADMPGNTSLQVIALHCPPTKAPALCSTRVKPTALTSLSLLKVMVAGPASTRVTSRRPMSYIIKHVLFEAVSNAVMIDCNRCACCGQAAGLVATAEWYIRTTDMTTI